MKIWQSLADVRREYLEKKLHELYEWHDYLNSFEGLFRCPLSDGQWTFLAKKNEKEIAEVERKLNFWKGRK